VLCRAGECIQKTAQLHLVDLAGSESLKRTHACMSPSRLFRPSRLSPFFLPSPFSLFLFARLTASLLYLAGETLKEANYINQSLSTLGLVIKTLAEHSSKRKKSKKEKKEAKEGAKDKKEKLQEQREKDAEFFVPYRNSILTFYLSGP